MPTTVRPPASAPPRDVPTQADVASLAGVSATVVSYVLNNGPRPVAPETRVRVLAAMERLSYRPNAGARALRHRRQQVLGLVVPDMANPFHAELASEIEVAARARGYTLLVCNALRDAQTERTYVDVLLEHHTAAVMMIGTSIDAAEWQELAQRGVSLIFVSSGPRAGFTTLTSGGVSYAQALVRHLIEVHGHRRIAYVGGPRPDSARFAGYLAALEAAKIPHRSEWVVRDGKDPEAGRRGLEALLDRLPDGERPTAVVASRDMVAIGVMREAANRGLRVPHDLAVVGYDGIALGAYIVPSLTTVAQDVHALAVASIDAVLRTTAASAGGVSGTSAVPVGAASSHVVVPARLVLRESCGCVGRPANVAR